LFDEAFGADPVDWRAASPLQQLHGRIAPFLAVCSRRGLVSFAQSQGFVD
jgi:hypothetical protein